MSHPRSTCVISLGLTIMDRCPECEKQERAKEEAEHVARAPFAEQNKWKPPPPPSVSHDGGKTWRRADGISDTQALDVGARSEPAKAAAIMARTVHRLKSKELAHYTHTNTASTTTDCDSPPADGKASISEPTERKGVFGK